MSASKPWKLRHWLGCLPEIPSFVVEAGMQSPLLKWSTFSSGHCWSVQTSVQECQFSQQSGLVKRPNWDWTRCPTVVLHHLQFLLEKLPDLLVVLFLFTASLVIKAILLNLVQLVNNLDVCFIPIDLVSVFPLYKTKSICCSILDLHLYSKLSCSYSELDRYFWRFCYSASLLGISRAMFSFHRVLSLAIVFQASCMSILFQSRQWLEQQSTLFMHRAVWTSYRSLWHLEVKHVPIPRLKMLLSDFNLVCLMEDRVGDG